MPAAIYPEAIFANDGQSGGSYTSGPPKLVLHTTETSGMPGYSGGATAPHITYDPRSRFFIQHTPFTTAARALKNEAGGIQTNRDTALQIEIICYSNKPVADQQPYRDWVGDLDKIEGALKDLQAFIDWVCQEWGVQKIWPGKQALYYGEANAPGFRMSQSEWDKYNGVCGHQHVPENTHWDPGALDWTTLMKEENMVWTKPGDPVNTMEDVHSVHHYQGHSVLGDNDLLYDENDPAFLDERYKIVTARLLSMLMQLDQRKADK